MFMAVVDTMVVGHVSARELAASALGNLYFYGLAGFGMGVIWAIDPVVSQARGAGHPARARGRRPRGRVRDAALPAGGSGVPGPPPSARSGPARGGLRARV